MTQHNGPGTALGSMADFTVPMAIRVAATLGVADHIAASALTATDLADRANVDAGPLDRMLRHLTSAGVLTRDDTGRYALTAIGEALRDDHPARLRARFDMDGALGRAELAFVELLGTIRSGKNAYGTRYGRSLWEDLAADPALSKSFDEMMAFNLSGVIDSILAAYDWASLDHVVDVGGGNGALLRALLIEYPNLRGTLVELPKPAAAAESAFAAAGLAGRVEVVSGSFFDPLPPGADAYLLSDVLHDWDDSTSKIILRRCAEAAGDRGQVLVIGEFGPDGESPSTAMDLRMLVLVDGRERRASEVLELAEDCGLGLSNVHAAGEISVIALRRPEEG
ncbi:methyltransferase [Actinomadura chokoriensis]|uniref:Methyltransferase n=1 Tax=Actinomadura chokoriensis TaxID=454156 RepID=A0ABV4R2J4_9ACTN